VITAGVIRYFQFPTFWLDEAFVAESLRDPTPQHIFAPLWHGQYFPRLYLTIIVGLRELLGYKTWVLRLLPFACFIAATILWARLLSRRAGRSLALSVLGGTLLLGSTFWLDQSIQLKQYTLDVLLSLIPFVIGDEFFSEALAGRRRKTQLVLLAIPCLFSYVYPISTLARVIGWYLYRGRREGWKVNPNGVATFAVALIVGLIGIWLTDHRSNFVTRAAYLSYWSSSTLGPRFEQGIGSGFRLLADFIWGWHHGRLQPLMILAVAPLQILGVCRVWRAWYARKSSDNGWGSRTVGSIALLAGTILASAVVAYPIAAGRLVLFAQIHTQILAIEGALVVAGLAKTRKPVLILLYAAICIVIGYSVHRYVDFVRSVPPENIRPMLTLINREIADTVLVHPCSGAQVECLPDGLPVDHISYENKFGTPQPGIKAWVLWTNLSDQYCRDWLAEARKKAISWQVVYEGTGAGLALAQF